MFERESVGARETMCVRERERESDGARVTMCV